MDLVRDVVAHLSDDLGVRVAAERPENPDERMVTVRRVGGGGDRFMDTARIDVTVWAESYKAAYILAKLAEESMFGLPAYSANVASVEQNSFYSNTYTDGTPRWTGVYVIVCNR